MLTMRRSGVGADGGRVEVVSRSVGQQLRRLLARPTAGRLREAVPDAQTGRSAEVEQLAVLLLAADRSAAGEVLASAAELLLSAAPSLWLSLDVAARRSWWNAPPWADAARRRVSQGRPGIVALVLASFHPSGYVREAAAGRLAERDDQLALPALVLRAADWVPQVRARARLALEQRLSSPSADVLLTVGPLAVVLGERDHGRWLLGRFQKALRAVSDDVLAPLLAVPGWRVRRAAYQAALADSRLSLAALVAAAGHDSDLVIRVRCAESAVRAAVAAGRADAVQPLTFSKTAAVRAGAVQALAARASRRPPRRR